MKSTSATRAKRLCADNVHEVALSFLDNAIGGKILDVPCGEGALLESLYQAGHKNIHGCDINIEQVKVNDIASITFADINTGIPHDAESFDSVFCIECIEHIENPFHLIRELSRVTKKGGRVVISTPNVLSTNARSKYLIAGYLPHFKELSLDWDRLDAMGFQGHISPIPINRLMYITHRYGLALEAIKTNKFKRRPGIKDRLLAKIIQLAADRFYKTPILLDALKSSDILFGDVLISSFRKSE